MSCPAATRGAALNRSIVSNRRNGFTLVELLVAMTISLIMVYAMVEIFRTIGSSTSDGRAVIDMQGQLKTARALLHNDLRGVTVPGKTWPSPGTSNGYFYYDEGLMATKPTGSVFFSNDVVPVYRTYDPKTGDPADRYLTNVPLYDDGQAGRGPWDTLSISQTNNNSNSSGIADNYHELEVIDIDTTRTSSIREADFNRSPHFRHAFGDVNDILMFTVRSTSTPFRGRYNGTTVESQLAEIIWWTQLNENPSTLNGIWDLGESFSLRRRVLLIRPDLNVRFETSTGTALPYANTLDGSGNPLPYPATLDPMFTKLLFLHDNDISVRVVGSQTASGAQPLTVRGPSAGVNTNYYLAANSLADLAVRHNRSLFDPYPMTLTGGEVRISPVLFHMDEDTLELCGFEPTSDMVGEDVVIRKVAGFDVRAFDPYAPIFQGDYGGNVVRVQPGDEAFAKVATDLMGLGTPIGPIGYGAYVDLGWGQTIRHAPAGAVLLGANLVPANPFPAAKTPIEARSQRDVLSLLITDPAPNDPQFCTSYFMRPMSPSIPARMPLAQAIIGSPEDAIPMQYPRTPNVVYNTNAYDTWSLAYESDGINQDNDGFVDEGRDGLSSDNLSERETMPQYDRQLRGIEVRIRMYDNDTRQVRQATVIGDLSDSH